MQSPQAINAPEAWMLHWLRNPGDWSQVPTAIQETMRTDRDVNEHIAQHLESAPPTLPRQPSPGLLMSMAIRSDHGLGLPGYYDSHIFASSGVTHEQRLKSKLSSMAQLYEEVSGHGFYQPELEAGYVATLEASTTTP